MEVNDQLSRYQAEYYVETVHDAFVNVQRLLNNYNVKINCLTDAIEEEKQYRKQTKKQRMRKPGAVFLFLIGFIFVLATIALLAAAGYTGYNYYLDNAYTFYGYNGLYVAVAALIAYIIVLFITCKIFAWRRVVGRRLKIKKAKKNLKRKIKTAEALTKVLTNYPYIYEAIHKTLVRTKRHPLGKIIVSDEDKIAIDSVKAFYSSSEEATKIYSLKEER